MSDSNPKSGTVRTLLVEDNPGDARLTEEYLREGAYGLKTEVHWVKSVAEALAALEGEAPFDIILLDLSLPDSSGLDTFTTVHAKARHVAIIVLSGQSDTELAVQMVKEGAQDHLSKNSLEPELIARAIRYAIQRKAIIEQLRDTQMQLIQAEKMESVGRLAAGVAHEVKNPLARILLGLEYLKGGIDPEDPNVPLIFDRIESAVHRADAIICEMVNFSSDRQLDLQITDLRPAVENALMLVDHELKKRGIFVALDIPDDLPSVCIDHAKIEQVLINLLLNAVHAIDEAGTSGRLTVTARPTTYSGNAREKVDRTARGLRHDEPVVLLTITDNGTGIPDDKASTIFDPFVTTKATGVGTGLGLTVVRKIIELHDGAISITNREDGTPGACASISIRVHRPVNEIASP